MWIAEISTNGCYCRTVLSHIISSTTLEAYFYTQNFPSKRQAEIVEAVYFRSVDGARLRPLRFERRLELDAKLRANLIERLSDFNRIFVAHNFALD